MATKKPMKFKGGGKIKRYYAGEVVTGDDSSPYSDEDPLNVYARNGAINRDIIARNTAAIRRAVANDEESVSPLAARNARLQEKNTPNLNPGSALSIDDAHMKMLEAKRVANEFNQDTRQDVRDALSGKRPPAQEFTQLAPRKRTFQDDINDNVAKALKTGKPPVSNPRDLEATKSRGEISSSTPFNEIPRPARLGTPESEALEGSHPEMILNPASFGIKTIATGAKALANMGGRNALKLAGETGEGILSAAGQRLKDLSQLRNTMFPGRNAAVSNPNAWAAGPKGMEKIAEVEGRAAAAEAKAAQAAARKQAAQARKDAKDPVMNARPGAGKAKPGDYAYESDVALSPMYGYKKGGAVKKFAKGGSVSSASSRGDGIAIRGKTKGTISKMSGGGMMKGRK